jgi:hypothetical protein
MGLSSDRIELLRKKISGWARQSRYRAKKNGCVVDVLLNDIIDLYKEHDYKCVYCGEVADSPDHPFPIKDHAPCVVANILPCCDSCRNKKRNRNIIWFYKNGHITKDKLISLINKMKLRKGHDALKTHIKTLAPHN